MPTQYTPQLGLSLPTQGELQGTWGDVTNSSMTGLVDTAIAGTTAISTDADVTLTATVGTPNQARSAILLCNGARTALRNLTAPATSKIYTVVNATSGGFGVVIRGVGPTAGVTVPAGKTYTVAWGGTDFVIVGTAAGSLDGVVGIANGGTGQTTAAAALSALGGAPIASPTFTGVPAAPTATGGTNTTQIATTAFVNTSIATAGASYAPLASPALTGVPTAPTAAAGTNTTQLATTAHVFAERSNTATLTNKTLTSPTLNSPVINSPTGLVKADVGLGNVDNTSDANKPVSTATQTALNLKADLASPALTGVPTAPTAAGGTNTTQIATTAYVFGNFAASNSPAFTGTPTAPTAAPGTNTTQIATTAFANALAFTTALPSQAGNAGRYVTTNGTTASWADPYANAPLTGVPTAPTAAVNTNTTQIATTAFVIAQAAVAPAPAGLDFLLMNAGII